MFSRGNFESGDQDVYAFDGEWEPSKQNLLGVAIIRKGAGIYVVGEAADVGLMRQWLEAVNLGGIEQFNATCMI